MKYERIYEKTSLGYRAVVGGHSDPECSHVILTKGEYDRMLREKAHAEQKRRNTAYEAERVVKRVRADALSRIRKAEEEARHSVEGVCGNWPRKGLIVPTSGA